MPSNDQVLKPWLQDLGDCGECRKDENCNQKITFNIDLKNVRAVFNWALVGDCYHELYDGAGVVSDANDNIANCEVQTLLLLMLKQMLLNTVLSVLSIPVRIFPSRRCTCIRDS